MPARASTLQKLDFNEKLIQSGKGGGTDALLKRLKTLHNQLKNLDQDLVDLKSVKKVTSQLIDTVILHHKDRGVKAFAACCLADILRLFAPDAPYNSDQLRDIFQFFIVQVTQNLKLAPSTTRPLAPSKRGNDNLNQTTLNNSRITEIPYYTEYCYLLDSLANIRSVVLVVDVPSADELITAYFDGFVDCVRADMNKPLIRNLVSILVEVIQEAETVPSGVMDCILTQFDNYAEKPDTPSFQLIVDVCNRGAVKLQRPTFAHFSDIQLTHGRDPSPSDLKALTESHTLLLSMFRNAPNLLLNVIPLLEENLRAADETPLRQLTTQTLGAMFGERPVIGVGVVDLARSYPATWRAWLGRRLDKAISVRVAWIEAAPKILTTHPELRKELEPCLMQRVHDADERARAAVCKVIGSVDYETALHHISEELLQAIGQRMSDKKAAVRSEAVTALAKLWSLAQSELEANDEDAVAKFGWIPQEMLHAIQRAQGAEPKTQIATAFKTHILPLPAKPDDEQAWVDRFLLVASRLDDTGLKTLDKLTGIVGYAKGSSPYKAFAELCEQYNSAIEQHELTKERLDYVADVIVRLLFGDTDKARKDMESFATANEPRLYKLLKALVEPQTGLRDIIKSRNELLRRIEQSHASILETFTVVIDSAAWMVINHSSIPSLIKRIQKPEGADPERTAHVAARYLALIAKQCAPMYKSHVPVLVIVINDKKNGQLVEIGLQALAMVCKWDSSCAPTQKGVLERAKSLALSGTPRQAKFAARFLVFCKDATAAPNLVNAIGDEIEVADDELLLPLLRASSELALSAPQHFKLKGEQISSFVLNELMPRRSPSADEVDDKWVDEDQLQAQDRAKVIAMSVLTHQCLGWARSEKAVDLATPTFTFLSQVLDPEREGMITADTMEGGQARVHLRLRATLCLLKLARVRAFDRAITPHFNEIALMMQDPIFTVRQRMLQKLADVLAIQRLMPRWNLLPILTAIDPERENQLAATQIMGLVVHTASKLRSEERIDRIEMPLARLLHLLALHPDLDWHDDDALNDIAKFIEMFIHCIANRDNVALLYTIVTKLKTVSVAEEKIDSRNLAILTRQKGDDDEEENGDDDGVKKPLSTINLYKMSEMAQIMLRSRAHHHQWPMTVYPGRIKLPADIFHNLPSPQVAQTVSRKTFLPDNAEWVKNLGKIKGTSAPQRRAGGAENRSPRAPRERKRKSTGERKAAAPRKKRRSTGRSIADTDSEDDDESSDEDDDSDEEMDEDDDGEEEEEAEEENHEVVLGRGGRRSAKTKAKKAVKKKRKVVRTSPPKAKKAPAAVVDDDSELSDLSD